GEMLCWDPSASLFDQREIGLRFGFGKRVLRMRVEGCAGAAGGVEKKEFRSERVRGDVRGSELGDAELEGSRNVHAVADEERFLTSLGMTMLSGARFVSWVQHRILLTIKLRRVRPSGVRLRSG